MLKALVVKELRETILIALAALVFYACYVAAGMGLRVTPYIYQSEQAIPFLGDGFIWNFALVSTGLAIALALRQSAWESVRGTFSFLLHRPVGWTSLLGTKIAVGLGLYLAFAAVPILIYAWWAATPGTHASPFFWSMTLPAWQAWISLTAVYLGAFLSGLRPARWLGSRLLPAAGVGGLVWCIQSLPCWWIVGLAAILVLDFLVAVNILFVARSCDYS
jgi:hypothetical protein